MKGRGLDSRATETGNWPCPRDAHSFLGELTPHVANKGTEAQGGGLSCPKFQ